MDDIFIIENKITLTSTELNELKDEIINTYKDFNYRTFELTITHKGDILINKEV